MLKEFLDALKSVTGEDYGHLESSLRSQMSSHLGMKDADIERVVSYFGDGELRDNSECSRELRGYLKRVQPVDLARHAQRLVSRDMNFRSYALMDVVNEVARRLGFDVRNGYYEGGKGRVSYGGLWRGDKFDVLMRFVSSGEALDIERLVSDCDECVKLDFLGEKSHVVLVVGREDTGALADQIRGSRHGWGMRIVGVEALVRMMVLYSLNDDVGVRSLVRSILLPEDYVRVDRLVDFVGSMRGVNVKESTIQPKVSVSKVAKVLKESSERVEKSVSKVAKVLKESKVRVAKPVSKVAKVLKVSSVRVEKPVSRVAKAEARKVRVGVSKALGRSVVRRRRSDEEKEEARERRRYLRDRMALYVEKTLKCRLDERQKSRFMDEKKGVGVCMLMSNRYEPKKGKDYFYNVSKQKHVESLRDMKKGYMFLSFGDRDDGLLIPLNVFEGVCKDVLYNEKLDAYLLDLKESGGRFSAKFPKKSDRADFDLTAYKVSL